MQFFSVYWAAQMWH